MKYRLTLAADRDIASILSATAHLFGPQQVIRYSAIISKGIAMLCEDPERASSHVREDLREGVRSFHLQLAAGRRGGAAHIIYYLVMQNPGSVEQLVILRVLAEEMEPKRRVAKAIDDG